MTKHREQAVRAVEKRLAARMLVLLIRQVGRRSEKDRWVVPIRAFIITVHIKGEG